MLSTPLICVGHLRRPQVVLVQTPGRHHRLGSLRAVQGRRARWVGIHAHYCISPPTDKLQTPTMRPTLSRLLSRSASTMAPGLVSFLITLISSRPLQPMESSTALAPGNFPGWRPGGHLITGTPVPALTADIRPGRGELVRAIPQSIDDDADHLGPPMRRPTSFLHTCGRSTNPSRQSRCCPCRCRNYSTTRTTLFGSRRWRERRSASSWLLTLSRRRRLRC